MESRDMGLLTVEQFGEAQNMGRTSVYSEIKRGRIRSVKVGRSRRIPAAEVQRYVDLLMREQDEANSATA